MLDLLAFIIWDVGTRPPLRALADVLRGLRAFATAAAGLARACIGLTFAVAAAVLVIPVVGSQHELALLELYTILVALGLELLVGDDVRALAGTQRSPDA